MTLHVELVVPEGQVWEGTAQRVIAKTLDGDIGVLTGHAPVLGILAEGSLVRSYTGSTTSQTATVNVTASNNGTVSVNEGTLYFGAGSVGITDSGAFNAAAGATLNIGGTRTEGSGATAGARARSISLGM